VHEGGDRWRAAYAEDARASRGRLLPETPSATRSEFQRDRDRVIHSTAFRRLAHKTQVFILHEGDHLRTRLTHTIEVGQIARALARSLGLDEDLAEALALAHDLGHTPFGHTGEDALRACMASFGGFDHNAQALRLVTRLERRYARHDGLNLAWETLEGIVKHNGPLLGANGVPLAKYAARGVPGAILEYDCVHSLRLDTFASAEAQCAAVADDIAYDAHDIDDGLRAGLFSLPDLGEVPFLAGLLDEIEAAHPGLAPSRAIHEVGRRVITRLVEDVLGEAGRRLTALAPTTADAVRAAPEPCVAFSSGMAATDRAIKTLLFARVYHHPRVLGVRANADAIVRDLYARLFADVALMPDDWSEGLADAAEDRRARRVADYIAGMTDRYAVEEHRRLFETTPDLR